MAKKSKNKSRCKFDYKNIFKSIKKSKLEFNLSEVLTITVISILVGILIGSIMVCKSDVIMTSEVPKDLEEFVATYNNIYNNYYDKVKKDDLIDAAIKGMVDSLDDPYSTFMEQTESENFNETVSGEYVGIGATITYSDNSAIISSMFDNSPAKKSGLKEGDKLIVINSEKIDDKSLSQITDLIKGKKDTIISIKVLRGNKEKEFKVKREKITIPSVTSKIFEKDNKKIGYIAIDIFSSNTYKEFKSELEELESKKIKSLIIDVRNNPGGHLSKVTDILELFLEKGKILYQIEKKGVSEKILSKTKEKRKYKIAVIINNSSASASEILASSLKESYNATIVGEKSYGKGTVQQAYQLSNGTTLKYTTQKWLTAKGKWINEKGVEPDISIELDSSYYDNPNDDNDNQLQKAIEELTK